jgi:thiol-disulfide isomerase/thioredoxin
MNRYLVSNVLSLAALSGIAFVAVPPQKVAAQFMQPSALKIGEPAPEFKVGSWIKGGPIDKLEKGKTYVIGFWASWCEPSRTTIARLNDLQTKYKDKGLVVINVNIWESDPSQAAPFVKEMGDKMNYNVAVDTVPSGIKGEMNKNWVQASDANGILTNFVVDKEGNLAYIGDLNALEDRLSKVLDGSFNAAAYAADLKAKAALNKRLDDALRNKQGDEALAAIEEIKQKSPERADLLRIQTIRALNYKKDHAGAREMAAKLMEGKVDDQILKGAANAMLEEGSPAENIELGIKIYQYGAKSGNYPASFKSDLVQALDKLGNFDEAIKVQLEILDAAKGPSRSYAQSRLASLYSRQGNHEEAIKRQQEVVEQSQGPQKLSAKASLAQFYSRQGKHQEAIKLQGEVVAESEGQAKERAQKTLDELKAASEKK